MRPRLELQTTLEKVLGSHNVYYEPPQNLTLKYPCIVYHRESTNQERADNVGYIRHGKYELMLISKNPADPTVDRLLDLKMIDHTARFTVDGLSHDQFVIYY